MYKMVLLFQTTLALLTSLTGLATAQNAVEKLLRLDGSVAPNGQIVELRWLNAKPPRVGAVTVNRRLLGQTGAQTWHIYSKVIGPVMRFTDTTTRPGIAYEYQVLRSGKDIVDVGYWATGVELPAVGTRGTAYMLVDETLAEDLDAHLDRFQRDLIGDGWRTIRRTVPRGSPGNARETLEKALAIRIWLARQYQADPFGQHTVILIGHVPLVSSGKANPDGHAPRPHPTDLFYADMNGRWAANEQGILQHNRIPGDFIEMQIGRIDFSPLRNKSRARELAFLRAYFDKNHHWRMGLHGDLRRAYGDSTFLLAERYGLRNIVGPEAITQRGHHQTSDEGPWLWGVDFGTSVGADYQTKPPSEAVFTLNFGSNKQILTRNFNAMTALMAQPWYPISSGWGGRPAWWLHHMALGGTIGEVHQRTVNNGRADHLYRETMDYFPTGEYLWRNPVWVNLLGDPTTRAFILAPPGDVTLSPADTGVNVSWQASPDPDTTGYRLFRADPGTAAFVSVNESPVSALSITDPDGRPGARYMVRAYGLKNVYAGSFHTLSQGAFSHETASDMQLKFELAAQANKPVRLSTVFDAPQGDTIYAFIEGPETGTLTRSGTGWQYKAPVEFTGAVHLRFSVSDRWTTQTGTVTIKVTAP